MSATWSRVVFLGIHVAPGRARPPVWGTALRSLPLLKGSSHSNTAIGAVISGRHPTRIGFLQAVSGGGCAATPRPPGDPSLALRLAGLGTQRSRGSACFLGSCLVLCVRNLGQTKVTVTECGLFLCQCPPGPVGHCHTLFVVSQRNIPVSSCRLSPLCCGSVGEPAGHFRGEGSGQAAHRPPLLQKWNCPILSLIPGARGLCRLCRFTGSFCSHVLCSFLGGHRARLDELERGVTCGLQVLDNRQCRCVRNLGVTER